MFCSLVQAQVNPEQKSADKGELKYNLSEDGKKYIKLTLLNQVWLRYNQSNPGTTVLGKPADDTFDIGLRRTRMQLYGAINEHLFFYTQFGMNNFNYLSGNGGNRKNQAFFHDALGEYNVFPLNNKLKLGAGLTICNGLSRFSQPSIGSIMTLDVPVFAQATVDQTDQFSRKLSVYARGQWGKLDYRIALSDPFPVTSNGTTPPTLGKDATFNPTGHTHQVQGLFIYNFLESEQHVTPYMQGTYLGKKKILNLEAGTVYQKSATWLTNEQGDTLTQDLLLSSVAVFADMPINVDKGTAFNAYLGYFNTNYGKNYIRNNGVMNPANGSTSSTVFSGYGNQYPMFGTGQSLYAQVGYLMKKNALGSNGTCMPFASIHYAQLQKIQDPVLVYDLGINWLIQGHNGKCSLDLQNRPVMETQADGSIQQTDRKYAVILQYQLMI